MPDENNFRYYRWRTLYGSRFWPIDAGFYEMLGALFIGDIAIAVKGAK